MCFIEINNKGEMSCSWKKQKYEKQWSQLPGKKFTTGYGKGKFTLHVVKCWSRLPREAVESPALGMLRT